MSETWRRKPYYRPRVLIDVARVLDPQFDDSLMCITGAQLEMLRNLTQYLHRRSTFVSSNEDGYYLVADNDDWDSIQAIVAELEETLMGCTEFTDLLQDILVQMQCVCAKTTALLRYGPGASPLIETYLDDGTMQDVDDYGDTTPADANRCAIAQLTYWQAWEMLTEVLQPVQENLMDILVPTVIALLVSMVGTPLLGIPAGVLVGLLMALADAATEGSLTNVQNEYRAYEEELICALYLGLDTSYRQAESDAVAVIADMSGLSPVDKIVLHSMMAPWAISLAAAARANATAWALANVQAGYCDDCDEVIGSDWWALYLDKDTNTVEIDDPIGDGWTSGCWEFVVPSGQTVCGVVFEVKNKVGAIDIKRMDQDSGTCGDVSLWGNNSAGDIADEGWYFAVNGQEIDEVDCKARLAPGSTDKTNVTRRAGPVQVSATFVIGFSIIGSVDIHLAWVVFEGTSPP